MSDMSPIDTLRRMGYRIDVIWITFAPSSWPTTEIEAFDFYRYYHFNMQERFWTLFQAAPYTAQELLQRMSTYPTIDELVKEMGLSKFWWGWPATWAKNQKEYDSIYQKFVNHYGKETADKIMKRAPSFR